jgi:hypothetical protein
MNPWLLDPPALIVLAIYYAIAAAVVYGVFFRSPFVRGSRAGSRPTTPASSVRSGAAGASPAEPRAAQGRQAQATPVERAVSSPGGRTLAPPASRPAVVPLAPRHDEVYAAGMEHMDAQARGEAYDSLVDGDWWTCGACGLNWRASWKTRCLHRINPEDSPHVVEPETDPSLHLSSPGGER